MTQNKNLQKVSFKVEGMSCSSCANNLQKKLNSLDGVINANVNIATEKGQVEYDSNKIDVQAILKAVENAGYKGILDEEKNTEKVTLKIKGMTCTACANKVEKTLNKVEGITSANVNFAVEKVTIEYDSKKVRLIDIQKKVSGLGYELNLEENEDDGVDEDEIKIRKTGKTMKISIGLSSAIMGLMIIHMFVRPIPGYLPIIAALGFPIVFGTGWHVHVGSWKALKNKSPNMDVLVTLGSLPPYMIGLMGLFFPIQAFIEMATTIMTFHLIGKYLEVRAKGRASQAIKKLLQMGAKTAKIIVDGEEIEIPVKDLQVGDIMVVRPGEKIPTDGVVVDGNGLLDESMATGESMPVKRQKGDEVIGATINKQGLLKVEVTKVGKDTFLSQVVKMMEECQGSKVPIQEFADRITGYFVPAIIIITIGTFISFNLFPEFHLRIIQWGATFLPWVNPDLTPLTLAFITSTAVLVISCPCALGLGTPTALMVGSGMGAEKGILIRNGEAIQTFKEVKAIAFDKTGTITKGKPEVTDLVMVDGVEEKEFLYYAGTIENGSEHPLAHAIVEKAKNEKIKLGEVIDFNAIVGMGVVGNIDGEKILVGNRKLMKENKVSYEAYEEELIRLEEEAKTAMMLAKGNQLLGIVAVADPIKEDSAQAIAALESMGIKTAMITGDNKRTAAAIGRKVGISHVIAEVLPDGKVEEVVRLQEKYGTVAMVGDGINDAPALKQANVGIAIGTGTDIAIEAADVTLVRGELSGIISAIKLSRAIFKKIKENYFWAWFYNAVFIPVAMFGLLHPMIGAAAMAVSSLNVVYNSLRLKKADIDPSYNKA
ncbi:heavy metal translocating P-type ATPase [Clostridium formicaceticum]|uniref:Copper-exporting P-type ATPase n=1 Tax=Clostridium formicaceticum TaxID=1497 RepID=A0AAC9RND4_9CLOT|nr:heavy metal translocating P-type ATPase [Clostridium formicaceticum]AOY77761.1 ATPase [Clostridium formicaceticum]ARE88360.1 Copper-exporting P-type ATPase A [Clostridium formicaceticum]